MRPVNCHSLYLRHNTKQTTQLHTLFIMASFVTGLWESVFQPGVSPQLILATHISFTALLATLGWLIFVTHGNIHFIALFIIASLLWITVIWFIAELKSAKLLSNEELDKKTEEPAQQQEQEKPAAKATTSATPAAKTSTRSRKA